MIIFSETFWKPNFLGKIEYRYVRQSRVEAIRKKARDKKNNVAQALKLEFHEDLLSDLEVAVENRSNTERVDFTKQVRTISLCSLSFIVFFVHRNHLVPF